MAKSHRSRSLASQSSSDPPQGQSRHVVVEATWSGPLPDPGALAQFNNIVPDGAERIFKMAEEEQAFRIKIETAGLQGAIAEAKRGQFLGASISIIALAFATLTVYLGAHWTVSVALVGIPIMGLVKAIVDRQSRKTEN